MAEPTDHPTARTRTRPRMLARRAGRRLLGRSAVTAVAAALVLGAGVGTSFAALTGPASGGATTPAGAVQALLAASDHADVLGALSVLDPGERAALEPNLVTLVHQLQRLQILAPDASLRSVRGLTLDLAGVHTKTTYLTPDLASVSLTAGTATSEVRLGQLPLGPFARQLAGGRLHGARRSTGSAVTGRGGIATVQEGGRWYVSLGYTIAVDDLRAGGRTGAPPPGGITPLGHPSAAAAVRDLLTEAARFDLRGVLADLPPEEMGALQAYAPRFLARGQRALDGAARRVAIQLGPVQTDAHVVPGGQLVQVALPDLTVHIRPSTTIAYRHGCLVESIGAVTVRRCRSATSPSAALGALPPPARTALAPLLPILERLGNDHLELGILAVDEGGKWYVSPVGTVLHNLDTVLGAFRPSDLTTFARVIAQLEKASTALPTSLLAPSSSTSR